MFPVIVFVLCALLLYQYYSQMKYRSKLPPGPKPLPIIGNVMNLPPKGLLEYQHWLKFKDAYGPISSVTVLGNTLIILHDKQAAHDLLEKSSSKTSSRPQLYFGNELCGFKRILSFMQYDNTFRRQRKFVHQQLGTKTAASRFRNVQDVESRRLLLRILDDSPNLVEHIKTMAGAIILQITYGYSIEPRTHDPLVLLIERMMQNLSVAQMPMHWAVDIFSVLKYIPEGLPGTAFKKIARKWDNINSLVIETPYTFVQQQMAKGSQRPSYVSSLIEQHNKGNGKMNEDEETAIKQSAAVMYAGGSDTTVSSISSFILVMTLFPSVQRKAQEEIDAIVGTGRLPQFEDRDNLPYVNALVKETLRWLPVVPLGVTHTTDEEMYYEGFRIPKGAGLLPAVWWFLHDPEVYPDPTSFEPERFLEPRNEPDPATAAFGYGRRICPGRFLADESLFLTISRLLAVFDITKAVDKSGKEIDPEINITPGLLSRPINFPYCIKPRSAKAVDIIRSVEVDHPWEKGDAAHLTGGLLRDGL